MHKQHKCNFVFVKMDRITVFIYNSVRRHNREGKQVAVHCHGERACELVLSGYEQVSKGFKRLRTGQ